MMPNIRTTAAHSQLDQLATELLDAIYHENTLLSPALATLARQMEMGNEDPTEFAKSVKAVSGMEMEELISQFSKAANRRERALEAYCAARKIMTDLGVL